jgi:CBS domain containing-hemolysin-like protein
MTVFFFILSITFLAALVVVASFAPHRARLSPFELARRQADGDQSTNFDQRREAAFADIVSLQRVVQAILLVGFVLTIVAAFGWVIGGLVAVVVSLEYGKLSAVPVVRRLGARLFDKYEEQLLVKVSQHDSLIRWFRSAVPASERANIDSREELAHLVEDSSGVLSSDEKKLILAGLNFETKQVQEIMTPKSVVDTVKRGEILGPLVLDDLHKTGHSRFPVIDEDIDHVVGILYVRDVLTLDTTRRHTAKVESAMSPKVHYIRQDHTLKQALSAFLSTHHHLFIVINEYRETVGILTLEDTLEALLGRRIVDEFDAHDDMRAVAARNAASAQAPNRPAGSKDV